MNLWKNLKVKQVHHNLQQIKRLITCEAHGYQYYFIRDTILMKF